LNGFSKMFALPGIKFGWMAVSGYPKKVRQAMRSLELISDTFLPVNEMVQAAAPDIFAHGQTVQTDFARQISGCWKTTSEILERSRECSYTAPAGGFYVSLRLTGLEEETAVESVLKQEHVLMHPGYFYDMRPDHLVFCFVQSPETIRDSVPKLLYTLERLAMQKPGK
jgi:alanine-synthesizing transaminase